MTRSLVVSLIWDLCISLTDVLDVHQEPAPDEDKGDASQKQVMILLCLQAFLKGFKNLLCLRWMRTFIDARLQQR